MSKQWIKDAAQEITATLATDEEDEIIWIETVEQIITAHAPKGEVDTSKERAAFEKWLEHQSRYININKDVAFEGWMARVGYRGEGDNE